MRGIAVTIALVALALPVAGCGDSDTTTTTETVTAEVTTPPEPAVDQAARAKALVRRYYRLVNLGAFSEAWNLLSPAVQAENGGFASWRDGYRFTESTTLASLSTTSQSRNRYEFAIGLRAVDNDACGQRVRQVFAGSWTVESRNGKLVATDIDATKTAGGSPITDSSDCSPPEPPSSPPPESEPVCDPNYEGACLDPNAIDYDCEDGSGDGPLYTGYVIVVGVDHYDLDRNGNGEGCE